MPVILTTQEAEIRQTAVGSQHQANSSQDPIFKIPNREKSWWSGSSDRALPSKHKTLSSNPNTTTKKKKKKK
jgi:hypothetical protein